MRSEIQFNVQRARNLFPYHKVFYMVCSPLYVILFCFCSELMPICLISGGVLKHSGLLTVINMRRQASKISVTCSFW